MNYRTIKQVAKESMRIISSKKSNTTSHIVKYFHPEGKSMPNGSHYQRGGFLQECRNNASSFVSNEGVRNMQCEITGYKGGFIVLSTGLKELDTDHEQLSDQVKQVISIYQNRHKTDSFIHNLVNKFYKKNVRENIRVCNVGNLFKGKYIGDDGEIYNEKSWTVEITGSYSKSLLGIAKMTAEVLGQKTVLVKDLNRNKFVLIKIGT